MSGIVAAMVLAGYLTARSVRAGPYVAVAAWLVGAAAAFASWSHACDPATGADCAGRGFVSIGVLAALSTGMGGGFLLTGAWARMPARRRAR